MTIQKFVGYFEQTFDSKVISKITCFYDGVCEILFFDGKVRTINTIASVYNSQFGIPFSLDGKLLFISCWDTGLHAYNIDTGEKVWHFKCTRITSVYVSEAFVVAIRYGESILKLDIADGSKSNELRSGTIEHSYELGFPFILVNTYRGKFSVFNMDSFSITKQYSHKVVTPTKTLSLFALEAHVVGNKLIISGLEGSGLGDSCPFQRVIDHSFLPME